jgi:glycosyltransferase involved in cell wall biosynthesis
MEAVPPLAAPCPVVVSPCGYGEPERLADRLAPCSPARQTPDRLRRALASGGAARLQALLWPEDLPPPDVSTRVVRLPPCAPPDFEPNGPQGTSGVLYHGPGDPVSLLRVLAGWSWSAQALPDYSLVIAGLDPAQESLLQRLAAEGGQEDGTWPLPEGSLQCVQPETLAELSTLYRSAGVVFHPAALSPWGDPALNALACARPVVAGEGQWADARLGAAGYLAPLSDPRQMGAALVTLLVDDDLAAQLAEAARQRSAGWRDGDFGPALEAAYRDSSGG